MHRRTVSIVGTIIVVGGLFAFAGDLDPPPGAIMPTMKTLTEIEPRTPVQALPGSETALHVISQSGSYYLTGNITAIRVSGATAAAATGHELEPGDSITLATTALVSAYNPHSGAQSVSVLPLREV